MTTKPTKLAQYLKSKGLTHRAFAEKAGIPHLHPMVGLWCKGKHLPGLDTAFAIEKGTGGAIPATYWRDLSVKAKAVRRVSRRASRRPSQPVSQ